MITNKTNCRNKVKYKHYSEAKFRLDEIMRNILFSSMNIYWCNRHSCFHLGHSKWIKDKQIISRYLPNISDIEWLPNYEITKKEDFLAKRIV